MKPLEIFLFCLFSSIFYSLPYQSQPDILWAKDLDREEAKISLSFKDAEIRDVLRVISLKSGINIVVGPGVEGKVTIELKELTWSQALEVIVRTYGFVYQREGEVIIVKSPNSAQEEELVTVVFKLQHITAKEAREVIKPLLSSRAKVSYLNDSPSVVVSDTPQNMSQIKSKLKTCDS